VGKKDETLSDKSAEKEYGIAWLAVRSRWSPFALRVSDMFNMLTVAK